MIRRAIPFSVEYRAAYDDESTVKRDANPRHRVCGGLGWHWGWNAHNEPVRLRCPCVDERRAHGPLAPEIAR